MCIRDRVTHKPIISCFSDRSTPCAFFHLKVNRLGLVQPSRIERYPLIWRGRLYGEIERAFVNSYSLSVQNITNRCFRHFGWVVYDMGALAIPSDMLRVPSGRSVLKSRVSFFEMRLFITKYSQIAQIKNEKNVNICLKTRINHAIIQPIFYIQS